MADDSETPKIQIDSDWKAEAQREKEKLAAKAKAAQSERQRGGGGPGQMPPANFETLVSTLATQALLALGAVPDPRSGQRYAMPELARHHIDMLNVIQEKTKGNLSEDEEQMVASTLYELRSRYIQVTTNAASMGGGADMAGGPDLTV